MKIILFLLSIVLFSISHAQYPLHEWSTIFGGSQSDQSTHLALDNSGNLISLGQFRGSVDFDPGIGSYFLSNPDTSVNNFHIQKLDNNGNFMWAKSILGSVNLAITPINIATDANGNIIIICRFNGTGTIDVNPGLGVYNLTSGVFGDFILKLDNNGNFIWAKGMNDSGGYARVSVLTLDTDNNIILGGSYSGDPDFDVGPGTFYTGSHQSIDLFVQKLDSAGDFIWVKTMTGPGIQTSSSSHSPQSIISDSDGNIYVAGEFQKSTVDFDPGPDTLNLSPTSSWWDIFVQKLDSNGNLIWAFKIGNFGQEQFRELTFDYNQNLIVIGSYQGILDVDPDTGIVNLTPTSVVREFFILKVDSSGSFIWAKSIENARFVRTDSLNNLYIVSSYVNGTDFDPNAGTFWLAPTGNVNTFILKLDSLGNFIWVTTFTGSNSPQAFEIDGANNLYITGTASFTSDFDPSVGNNTNSASNGDFDWYVVKLNQNGLVSLLDNSRDSSIRFYPNPSSGRATVEFDEAEKVEVYNLLGVKVFDKIINKNHFSVHLDLSDQPTGMYLIKVKQGNSWNTGKLFLIK